METEKGKGLNNEVSACPAPADALASRCQNAIEQDQSADFVQLVHLDTCGAAAQ
jgi:hypothetical protein